MRSLPARPIRVLIADSASEVRDSVSDALTALGISCLEASDGLGAWRRFQADRPDAILAGLAMSGLTGVELLTRVRKVSNIPFIIQATTTDDAALAFAIRSGADEVIRLPSGIDELPHRVIAAVERHPNRSSVRSAANRFLGKSKYAA